MEIPFDVACRFMYRPKTSYVEYEKNGLNKLLEKMYYKYKESLGALAPLPIFNASYAIAVALVNTPNIARKDIGHEIEKFVSDTCWNHFTGDGKYHNDAAFCIGLAFCILRLQEENPDDSRDYLMQFSGSSGIMAVDRMFVRMVLNTDERFRIDLHPCAPKVGDLTDDLWENTISRFSNEELEEALTYYRTKEEQHAFLRWANRLITDRTTERVCVIKARRTWRYSLRKRCELSRRIDAGEFLVHPVKVDTTSSKTLPQLVKNADKDSQAFQKECQLPIDICQAKIRALEAQLASERKKRESDEAKMKANEQIAIFNKALEDKYDKLQKKYNEEMANNKVLKAQLEEERKKEKEWFAEGKRNDSQHGKLMEQEHEGDRNTEEMRQLINQLLSQAFGRSMETIKEVLLVLNRYNIEHQHMFDAPLIELYKRLDGTTQGVSAGGDNRGIMAGGNLNARFQLTDPQAEMMVKAIIANGNKSLLGGR